MTTGYSTALQCWGQGRAQKPQAPGAFPGALPTAPHKALAVGTRMVISLQPSPRSASYILQGVALLSSLGLPFPPLAGEEAPPPTACPARGVSESGACLVPPQEGELPRASPMDLAQPPCPMGSASYLLPSSCLHLQTKRVFLHAVWGEGVRRE